jgi:glycosyltransferase involved in cell wall biosynthesis
LGRVNRFEFSRSWKITRPLRNSAALAKRVKTHFKNLQDRLSSQLHKGGGITTLIRKWLKILRDEGFIEFYRRFKKALRNVGTKNKHDFLVWQEKYSDINDLDPEACKLKIASFNVRPLISILMPVYKTNHEWLIDAIESVIGQTYPNWELCIADDASQDSRLREILKGYSTKDSRIKLHFSEVNEHISAASNHALTLASGEWVGLLDHDDLLDKNALLWIADSINASPNASLIYSDEAKIDEYGNKFEPYFKPDWNRDLFYSQNYICHFGVYKASILMQIGGFRVGFEGAQDYDLALRFIEQIPESEIVHVPRLLYYWRAHQLSTAQSGSAKNYAKTAGQRVLQEHLDRLGVLARVVSTNDGYRVSYSLPKDPPLVSLIIPTKNAKALVKQCIESITNKTTYQNYEIILVDNSSDDEESLAYFKELQDKNGVRVFSYDGEFNYSAINNFAVSQANGVFVCLVNNDVEVISPEWLGEMVSLAVQPRVGAVGAKLLYPDSSLQHGGVVLGIGGVAGHSHKYLPSGEPGYFNRINLISAYSAVTAACLLVRKELFIKVGGLNEKDLRVAFNDVDFCLKIREAGFNNVWTPYAKLFHHESATRGFEDNPEKVARFNGEVEYMKHRWGDILLRDPAYNTNLSLEREDFSLAFPPRI